MPQTQNKDEPEETNEQSKEDEMIEQAAKDKEKTKYQFSKDLVKRFTFAQAGFKSRLESQLNQASRHGEHLKTGNLDHKQLYGYISTQDALELETVKQDLFPDYEMIKKEIAHGYRRAEMTMEERDADSRRPLAPDYFKNRAERSA